jgi:hypothetical protein
VRFTTWRSESESIPFARPVVEDQRNRPTKMIRRRGHAGRNLRQHWFARPTLCQDDRGSDHKTKNKADGSAVNRASFHQSGGVIGICSQEISYRLSYSDQIDAALPSAFHNRPCALQAEQLTEARAYRSRKYPSRTTIVQNCTTWKCSSQRRLLIFDHSLPALAPSQPCLQKWRLVSFSDCIPGSPRLVTFARR